MFWTRVASGIVLLIILGFVFITGGNVLLAFLGIISFIGLFEYYRTVGLYEKGKSVEPLTLMGYLGCLSLYCIMFVSKGNIAFLVFAPVVTIILMLAVYVLTFPKYNILQVVHSFFGLCYAPLLLVFVYLTRQLQNGIYLVWLVFMSSWICDIFAYCVGMLFGKHKLAPVLSPKKSIEGAVGGVVFSAIFGCAYGAFISKYVTAQFSMAVACAAVCAVGAVVSQIGDLAASAIKRNFEIKDYGHLIPGHGGILDRFDSVIFAAPMVYIVSVIFTGMN